MKLLTMVFLLATAANLEAQERRRGPELTPALGYHFLKVTRPPEQGIPVRETEDAILRRRQSPRKQSKCMPVET